MKEKINDIQDEIIEEMASLDDWLDKYQHLIRLGRSLKSPGPSFRNEENAIGGCQSSVWISADLENGGMRFLVDSDSVIVRGMLTLLMRVLNGRLPEEIAGSDLYFLDKTGLLTNLSPSRANGLAHIVKRLKSLAAEKA